MKKILILLPFFYFSLPIFAQKSISGVVTDTNELPLFGVTVLIKGTSIGTITDIEGKYFIEKVDESNSLVFRYLGFETQEVRVGRQAKIDIVLSTASIELDETVVVGYGTSRKIDLTGAVATVSTEELSNAAISNFDQALAGRVSGVQVTSTDGTPGEPMNIVIRGGNSITGDNSPLYVIDGVPMESFDPASISTRDIKTFDILKDASSAAIYGARGANGVVLITTNDASEDGKTTVRMHASGGVQYIPNRLDVMTGYEYVQYMQKIALAQDNYVPGSFTNTFNNHWVDPELYRNQAWTNWQDEIFQTSYVQDYNFSISSGTSKTSIYYSGSYLNQNGTLINTAFNKYNNRLRFKSEVSDDLTITGLMTYDYYIRQGLQVRGDERTSVIRDAVVFRPVNPLFSRYDEESYIQDQDPYLYNPVASLMNTDRKRTNDVVGGNLNLTYEFLNNFTANVSGNYNRNMHEQSLFYGADTHQAARSSYGINGSITNIVFQTLTNTNTLQYQGRSYNSQYDILLGFEYQNRINHRSYLRNTNIPTDIFGINNLGLATTPTIATSNKTGNTLLSYFSRINYNYDDRYLLTFNFRSDGSSKFRQENRWGYFPSFSTAWRISEESFLKGVDEISNLKLRLGWGITGNNRIGDYQAFNLIAVSSGSGYVLGEEEKYYPGAYQSNMGVPDLKWESTHQYNTGLDFGFLRNRINGTIDYYLKRTKDLLLNAQMAPSTGFTMVQQNIGEVENKGLEISINTVFFKRRNFMWKSNFNISFNRNKTIKLNNDQNHLLVDPRWDIGYTQTEYQYITQVGEPVGMIYGLEYDGIYQFDDFDWDGSSYQLKDGLPTYGSEVYPGLIKFKDQLTIDTDGDGIFDTADGVINEDDRVIIGNPHPKHIGGYSHQMKYRNFDIEFLFQWAYGFDILNANKALFSTHVNNFRSGFKELTDIWTPFNTDTNISGTRFDGHTLVTRTGYRVDSRYVDDGSYLKFKTFVIGYSLPRKIISKTVLDRCRFSFSAQNLFTLTKYKGYDPDVSAGKFGALTPNLDYSAYPQSVAISFGVDLRF